MPTQKQLQANRLNAQRSTGPSSAEGKVRSSCNALKSGIHAEAEVLPWEDPEKHAALRDEYHAQHQPITPEERALVEGLAHGEYLMRRFRRSEVKIILSQLPPEADLKNERVIGQAYCDAGPELARLQRRIDATNRAFHRDLDQLRLLKAERPIEAAEHAIPQPEAVTSESALPVNPGCVLMISTAAEAAHIRQIIHKAT